MKETTLFLAKEDPAVDILDYKSSIILSLLTNSLTHIMGHMLSHAEYWLT